MPKISDILTADELAAAARAVRSIKAADWLRDNRPSWDFTPHDNGQIQALTSPHKIRVMIPGNGWGKTTLMAVDLDLLMQRNDPFKPSVMPMQLNGYDRPTTAIWFCQKYAQFEIMKPDLENLMTRGWTWNGSKNYWIWPNGSRCFVLSSDSDWSAIQGVEIDAVYFDEHPDRKMWVEMMYRRRGQKKTRYVVAATMTQGMTWFVRDVVAPVEKHYISQGKTHAEHLELQTHPSTFLWDRGGIMDNPAMDAEDIEHYQSVVGVSDKEMEVRTGGGYADFTGEAVFDAKAVKEMAQDVQAGEGGSLIFLPDEDGRSVEDYTGPRDPNVHRFYGVSDYRELIQWRADWPVDQGRITLYEPPLFDEAANYIIGADFAYGLVGKDYDAAVVVRKTADGQVVQVAEAQGHWGDVFFAEVLYMLGVLYFEAFIVGERQVGLPCLRRLYDEMGYGYMYYQRREDTRARRFSDLLGHHKSSADTIIPNIRVGVRSRSLIVRSDTLHQEIKRYQFRPKNKTDLLDDLEKSTQMVTGAPDGEHDDLVMAAAYAYHGAREIIHYQKPARPYRAGSFGDVMNLADELAGKTAKPASAYRSKG